MGQKAKKVQSSYTTLFVFYFVFDFICWLGALVLLSRNVLFPVINFLNSTNELALVLPDKQTLAEELTAFNFLILVSCFANLCFLFCKAFFLSLQTHHSALALNLFAILTALLLFCGEKMDCLERFRNSVLDRDTKLSLELRLGFVGALQFQQKHCCCLYFESEDGSLVPCSEPVPCFPKVLAAFHLQNPEKVRFAFSAGLVTAALFSNAMQSLLLLESVFSKDGFLLSPLLLDRTRNW